MSNLWAVNSLGKVYSLSTGEQRWAEVPSCGIDFKKVSSHEFFTWAISGDHQIYIFVPRRDIPIRCRLVTYENERWNPFSGFCSKLLPTDRPRWSSADGLVALPQESFQLPSKSWEWEEEWYVEDNLDGTPLEPEGWTYAVDFPAKYGPSKVWNSTVRRRKWIRYRRFIATSKWAPIPSIHEDPVLEPFIDVAIGGTEIPGGESSNFSVWAVTIMGRILFRYGVTESSPEGSGWVPIQVPDQLDVSQISVAQTGLTWAVTWSGNCLVRTGVTRENNMGSNWIVIDPPNSNDALAQISVGKNTVWALSKDNKVWFRKGVNGLHSGENNQDATGTGWVQMYGTLANISVGLEDQVFSISSDACDILLRTGVNTNELCGRTWKAIEVSAKDLHHSPSSSSLDTMSISSHRDSLYASDSISLGSTPRSSRKISGNGLSTSLNNLEVSTDSSVAVSDSYHKNHLINSSVNDCTEGDGCGVRKSDEISLVLMDQSNGDVDIIGPGHDRFQSIVNRTSSSTSLDVEAYYAPEVTVVDHCCVDALWIWLSASGCLVNPESLPYWFSEGESENKSAADEPWYPLILSRLKDRYKREVDQFQSYPRAIEKSTWVKTVTCRWLDNSRWVNCLLELVQHGDDSSKDTITCHHKNDQTSIHVKNLTCAVCLPDWNKNILVLHTAKKTLKGSPYKFSFTSNEDLEDWLATLNSICHNVHNIPWIPEKQSVWSLTMNGDVFVSSGGKTTEQDAPLNMKWCLLGGGHLRSVETCPSGITWGLGYNCIAWVYTKGYGGGPFHGVSGSNVAIGSMSDIRCLYIYENQRWNPLSGFVAKGLPTDRYMWSDQTGRIECTKDNTHLPSGHWVWVSDWCIDYKTSGGVDSDGWQYASDFPRSYHGYKRFTDYVRRRRWYRKCKLNTTGPWKKLGNTPLLDLSFQMEAPSESETIAVWAVAFNGDVLCRVGVSKNCPAGYNWLHIPSEKPFRSISIGGNGAIWGIAEDGSAQLRHGICSLAPTGQYWCHIEPPQVGCPLKQISAGKTKVFAVDASNRLWSRQEIVPIFKEGTHWKLVSEDVQQVSVGPTDQVWSIKSNFVTSSGVISGVVCRRDGITEETPLGTEWAQGIGGCWTHVTARGCT